MIPRILDASFIILNREKIVPFNLERLPILGDTSYAISANSCRAYPVFTLKALFTKVYNLADFLTLQTYLCQYFLQGRRIILQQSNSRSNRS